MSVTISNKKLSAAFFIAVTACPGKFKCKCCGNDYSATSGPTNLISHVRKAHPKEVAAVEKDHIESIRTMSMVNHVMVQQSVTELLRWIEAVTMLGLPLRAVSCPVLRSIVHMKPICVSMLLKGMRRLYHGVVQRVKAALPTHFGVEYDSAKISPTLNALAVYAVVYNPKTNGSDRLLLAFTPLMDATNATAENYAETLKEIVGCYERPPSAIKFTAGDNCNTNRAVGRLLNAFLAGDVAHLWSLALKEYSEKYDELINAISVIMSMLMNSFKMRNKLKEYSHVAPKLFDDQRWSSCGAMLYAMDKLYDPLMQNYSVIGGNRLRAALLAVHKDELQTAAAEWKFFDRVTEKAQLKNLKLGDIRRVFDAVLVKYPLPCFQKYISMYGSNVPNAVEMAAVTKYQMGRYAELTVEELAVLDNLVELTPASPAPTAPAKPVAEDDWLAEAFAPKRANITDTYAEKYKGVNSIVPSSVECERLFSQVKWDFHERRHRMHHETLEMLVMLKSHRNLWNIEMLVGVDVKDKPNPTDAEIEADLAADVMVID